MAEVSSPSKKRKSQDDQSGTNKPKVDDLEKKCRILEAQKQEILMKEEMRFRMMPVDSIGELRAIVRDMMGMLEQQSETLIKLENDNEELRRRLDEVADASGSNEPPNN